MSSIKFKKILSAILMAGVLTTTPMATTAYANTPADVAEQEGAQGDTTLPGQETAQPEEENQDSQDPQDPQDTPDTPDTPEEVIKVGKAQLVSVTSVKETLQLKWKAKGNVSGYLIYRKTSDSDYKKIKTIRDKSQVSYVDQKVTPNKTYRYKIICFYRVDGEVYYGSNSNPISGKVKVEVGRVKSLKVKAKKISLKLNWKKSGKVSGFFIYKKSNKGSFKRIAKVEKKSYLDEKIYLNQKYSYKLRPYRKMDGKVFFGEYTKPVSGKAAVKAVKRKITDKNSGVYGKTILTYEYNDGTMVENPEKYLDDQVSYVMYINKSRQMVTAYAKVDQCLVPVKVFICSPGYATPIGTFHLNLKYRWHELMGPCWGQYCSRITTDGIYFHSIFSSQPNSNKTMSVSAYNKLGTICSHGCVRLQAYAAKWIFDHCPIGTEVVIYNGSGYEPFKKPVIGKLPYWHTWDPTDETAAYLCKQHKCHQG
ncbi:MAG: L,D-transpeptidase family protein [Lachnospiraceae bacterium]|nr:L,D-transpeptidase family protein [Lachnospiraceae bacterium]